MLRPRAREIQEYRFCFAQSIPPFPFHAPLNTPLFVLPHPALGLRPILFLIRSLIAPTRSFHSLPPRIPLPFFLLALSGSDNSLRSNI
jgi:hypothetical protein